MRLNPVQERLHSDRQRTSWHSVFVAYEETSDRDPRMAGIPEWHLRCSLCGQSVLKLMSEGTSYHWTPEFLLDRFTAHMRQCHSDVLDNPTNLRMLPQL